MSFVPVLAYTFGIPVVGFVSWLCHNLIRDFLSNNLHETGTVLNFMLFLFPGMLIIYLVFGGLWVVRKYNEREYTGGF